jgi:hypothetical protein
MDSAYISPKRSHPSILEEYVAHDRAPSASSPFMTLKNEDQPPHTARREVPRAFNTQAHSIAEVFSVIHPEGTPGSK